MIKRGRKSALLPKGRIDLLDWIPGGAVHGLVLLASDGERFVDLFTVVSLATAGWTDQYFGDIPKTTFLRRHRLDVIKAMSSRRCRLGVS